MASPVQPSREPRLGRQLELVLGAMFSGKTSELIRRLRRHQHAGKKTLLVKWSNDTRYSTTHVVTHDRDTSERAVSVSRISDLTDQMLFGVEVLGIDEGQFFPGLNQDVRALIETKPQMMIIIAALNANSMREPFGEIHLLTPIAHIETKTGVCYFCKYDGALNSARLVHNNSEVLVGGDEVYKCVCDHCHRKYNVV